MIEGTTLPHRKGHAVAYDHGRICDPQGQDFLYSPAVLRRRAFFPRHLWCLDKIGDCRMSENIQRNNELYPAVVAGDAAAREAMILNNLGLVVTKANALICQVPGVAYLRDDLVSAGNIGLVTAVNQIAAGRVRMKAVNTWLGRVVTACDAPPAPTRTHHPDSARIPPQGSQRESTNRATGGCQWTIRVP